MTKTVSKSAVKIALICLISLFLLCISGFALTYVNANDAIVTDVKITIDFAEYDEKFPDGVLNKNYRVFDATAKDNLGNDVVVDYIVTDPNNKVVLVSNNKFKTELLGQYVITYKATSGVVEDVETVVINVVEECQELSYEFSSNLNSEGVTGELYYLFDGKSVGGVGTINTVMTITYNGETIQYSDFGQLKYFKPIKSGVYKINVVLTDFVDNVKSDTKDITISDSNLPLMSNPSLALINKVGDKVKLPMIDAVLYANGQSYFVPVKVYYDNVDITSTMTYTATTAGEHTVTYEAVNVFDNNYKAVKTYNVPAVEESKDLYVSNYFALDNFVGSYPESADGYVLTTQNDYASFQFKSKIHEEFASINLGLFGIEEISTLPFESIDIVLTDSNKGDEKVTLSFVNDKVMKVYNNGIMVYESESTLLNVFRSALFAKYDYLTNSIVDANGVKMLDIEFFDNGSLFTGFSSGYLYVSCRINGVVNETSLSVRSIATVAIAAGGSDMRKPMFCTTDDFSGSISANVGQTIKLVCPKAFDLLNDDKVTYTIQIVHTKNTIDGIISDKPININGSTYDLYIDDIGSYNVRFFANDSCGNQQRATMTIHVEDRISPSIEIKDFDVTEVVVGQTITLPMAEVSDNITFDLEKMPTFIYVKYGDYFRDTVYGNTFTFNAVGEYVFTYAVWDEAGNHTTVKYVVNCVEKGE